MKSEKRIQQTSFAVYFLMFGLVLVLAALFHAMMYPSKSTISFGILIAGGVFAGGSFILSPSLAKDIVTSRKSWLWINDLILVLAIIGIGTMLAYIGHRHHYRYDFTRDRLFSISDQTIKIVRDLKKEVKLTGFYPTGSLEWNMVEDLLAEYRRINPEKFSFKIVDPFKDPISAKAMNVRANGTVVVQSGENRKDVSDNEIFQRPMGYMRQQEKPKFTGEQALTSALLTVTTGSKSRILFTTGHEEPSISAYNAQGLTFLQQFLSGENYEVAEASLMEPIATDTRVVVVLAPKKSFHPSEIQALRDFTLNRKGRLLIAMDPDTSSPELEKFMMETFGILLNSEVIINPRGVNGNPTFQVPTYESHPIVKDLMEKKSGILMQLCRGITSENKPDWQSTAFLKTNDVSYGKRNLRKVYQGDTEFENGVDVRGPLNLGIALQGQNNASGSRVVVLGDSDFTANNLLRVQGNVDLVVNVMNWLAGQEHLISIRPKTLDIAQVNFEKLDKEAANRIFIMVVIVAPLMVVFVGGLVWFSRRRV